MAYIQILPVAGTGAKIYPDAAMDAGTRALIDTIDPWSWGGAVPAQGAAIALGRGPLNYPLAEDGWIEDAAATGVSGLTYDRGAVRFIAAADRLVMPSGFKIKGTETQFGLLFWAQNAVFPSAPDGGNNNLYADYVGSVANFSVALTYASGVVTSCRIQSRRHNNIAVPTAWRTALFDGALHQFGIGGAVASDAATITYSFYLDGALVGTATAAITAPFAVPSATDYACFGRHGINIGAGLYGRLWRAAFEDMSVAGSRTFASTIALDYQANAARIAAVA